MGPAWTDTAGVLHVRRGSTAFLLLAEWIIHVALLRDILGRHLLPQNVLLVCGLP